MNKARQVPKPSALAERGLLPPEAADCATALAAESRRPERCKNRDQELKREPFPCLINSAGSYTYPTRKSVRRTRATPVRLSRGPRYWPAESSRCQPPTNVRCASKPLTRSPSSVSIASFPLRLI
jgi:hypothetical protein